jgi:K+-transporting ATPase KdpF subunit
MREGVAMTTETIVALILAIAALGYLLFALLRPEDL